MENSEPTTVVVETQMADPPAYAWQDETVHLHYRLNWRRLIYKVAKYLLPSAAVIAAVMFVLGGHPEAGKMPPPSPAAMPTVNPAAATSEDQNSRYLRLLAEAGFSVDDAKVAINHGHWVCSYLSYGHSQRDTLDKLMEAGNSWTMYDATSDVNAAVKAYCPQFG